MPSRYRDPDAPVHAFAITPKPRAPRISDESRELRIVTRDEVARLDLTPAHHPRGDAYRSSDETVVVA